MLNLHPIKRHIVTRFNSRSCCSLWNPDVYTDRQRAKIVKLIRLLMLIKNNKSHLLILYKYYTNYYFPSLVFVVNV